ncbi:DUF1566 domain-containing protein [Exilibacterium tricleocarpae]|uniref:Lcl C-terminal domain-containing protein n=1 Tax=Exilibacterium tricleocarpae TaxID=2591008 RepID=UPI0015D0E69F|nr:DUF1566 domain-containing protein [Exilibacterium tricleocarpae]
MQSAADTAGQTTDKKASGKRDATGLQGDVKVPDHLAAPPALNDTGITWGGNYPRGVNTDCTATIAAPEHNSAGNILVQQDCANGTDARNGGVAGFVYHKVSDTGERLPAAAPRWHCVIDAVSGLMWEVKQAPDAGAAGLHHSGDLFTWYNSNERVNGGNIGDWNSRGDQCSGYVAGQPRTYCHVEQFVSRVNKQGLCGYRDWRLPTRPELTSLIHFGRTEPAIDTDYFPATQSEFYWSASAVAGRELEAWAVSFQFGFTTPLRRSDTRYARLVRTITQESL